MKLKSSLLAALLLCTLALGLDTARAQSFYDGFETNGSIGSPWNTDRYDPNAFESVLFDGGNRLRITISSDDSQANRLPPYDIAFYNTQGRQRDSDINGPWTVAGSIYVSPDFLSGDIIQRSDLWARTGTLGDESTADYAIIGIVRNNPLDPTDTDPTNFTTRVRVYDADTTGWIDIFDVSATGWYDLSINGSAAGFEYALNGTTLHTDNTAIDGNHLTTTFVEAYNSGDSYSVHWDDISAQAVPEPSAALLLGVIGFFGLMRRRR